MPSASGPRRELGNDGFHELPGHDAGGGELRFQLVHQDHQFVDLGDDAALFGEGWEGKFYLPNLSNTEAIEAAAGDRQSLHDLRTVRRI